MSFMESAMKKSLLMLLASVILVTVVFAQNNDTSPSQASPQDATQSPAPNNTDPLPVFRVKVYSRSTNAVNYRHRGGSTTVDFRGTDLMPSVGGHAKVDGKAGRLAISAELTHLAPANGFGGQFLTYVLWAITPEGRAVNLGEILPGDNGKDKIDVTTDLQAFGLIVTAEPYYAVTHPSNKVVAENILRQETKGFEEPINANFDVLEGGQYIIDIPAEQLPSNQTGTKPPPLDLQEARNAVVIAKAAGADQYAAESLAKAQDMLTRAEDYYVRKQGRTPIGTAARGATQMAEDARLLTLRRKEQARVEAERLAHQQAQEKAEAEAKLAQDQAAAAQAQSDEDARKRAAAEHAQADAERAQAEAQRQQADALAAQQKAQAESEAARLAADQAEKQRQEAENQRLEAVRQKEAMRARLLAQLNQVLQTRDTARGLIVSMPDVLFDFNKFTLKPDARERLARISGIVLAYPDLRLEIDGYTDSVGSDTYNQTLSDKRAGAVRDYLVSSSVSADNVTAHGMGKADPIADNGTAAGRKLNRRVEMIVSGDVIGNASGSTSPDGQVQGQPVPNPQ
jgi:outer membrane protein OmpA-like peptidoglycan-associated protein